MTTLTTLPAPTDDLERAGHELREQGICVLEGVLDGGTLRAVRESLYAAAAEDRARGRVERFTGDYEHDDTNQRVWSLLSRAPVFEDLALHPVAMRLLRSVLGMGWPMLLGNLSANSIRPCRSSPPTRCSRCF